MPVAGRLKDLLVIVRQLTGWPVQHLFPLSLATPGSARKTFLEQIIPCSAIIGVTASGRGTDFPGGKVLQ